jgi:integrase/recombinase XerD
MGYKSSMSTDIINQNPSNLLFRQNRLETSAIFGESLQSIIENYISYYASGDTHTAKAKRYDLQYFLKFLAGNREPRFVQVSEWTLQKTNDFIEFRLSKGESPATVSRRLATVKHFGRTLAERFHGYINPAREAKSPSFQMLRPKGLSATEINLLIRAAAELSVEEQESFVAIRNEFILHLLLATGLRADEVRRLVLSQISEDRQWLKNVKTKGKKFRNVYLDTEIRSKLERYLIIRRAEFLTKFPLLPQGDEPSYPLFLGFRGAILSDPSSFLLNPKTIWSILSNFGLAANIRYLATVSPIHPHRLRHTFAHGLLDSSGDVRLVAQALGHSDVRTTMRYTERSDEQIAQALEKKRDLELKQGLK